MQLFNLWPVPVYVDQIVVNPKWIKEVKKEKYHKHFDNSALCSDDYYILNKLKDLKGQIQLHIQKFTYDILKVSRETEFYITTSWVNKHNKNDFGGSHIHSNSVLSGVYYLQNDLKGGNIVFEKVNSYNNLFTTTIMPQYSERNIINSTSLELNCTNGMIVLFPSLLQHYVQKNMNNKERYSIAFNVFLKGQFGDAMNIVDLK